MRLERKSLRLMMRKQHRFYQTTGNVISMIEDCSWPSIMEVSRHCKLYPVTKTMGLRTLKYLMMLLSRESKRFANSTKNSNNNQELSRNLRKR